MHIEDYINYGCTSVSYDEDTNIVTSRAHWCMYKLRDLPHWICFMAMDEWNPNGISLGCSYQATFATHYQPEQTYDEWWADSFTYREDDFAAGSPDEDIELALIEHFEANVRFMPN
jgi:hypothetical protein